MQRAPADLGAPADRRHPPLSKSAVSWAFVESGRSSYTILIAIYIFVPYLASVLVSDPVKGQAIIANLGQGAGLAAALMAPLLGTTIDHVGRRKHLLVWASLLSVPLGALLWLARPGGLDITATATILAIVGVTFTLAEVVHNSLLVHAARRDEWARASGLSLTLGNGAAVVLMIIVLWAFVLPGAVHLPFVPDKPLLGLNAARHEPERFTGPLCAVMMVLSLIPLMLFTRDAPASSLTTRQAIRQGLADLRGMLTLLKEAREARKFLIARMIFMDAMGGVFAFTGVFAAGVLGWGPTQLLVEGIAGSVFAAVGGLVAGWLDPWLGCKRSLLFTLSGCLLCIIGEIGVGKDHIFFMAYDPALNGRPWPLPLFNTWPEWLFIACDFGVGVFSVSALASSRTFMAELAPPGRTTAFFGLFALSGRATAWLAPMLVGAATLGFHSQQMGYVPLAGLLLIGSLMLAPVRTPTEHVGADPAGLEAAPIREPTTV
ncbi:MFS transporter [Phenylobacterium montanum]|uniref:MFS transporter n=1 Tax=Phenylobacterium montanum TaxID=2823693 RepID=A0A975IWU0_9CAUL|nr:MFS transporter [Caulobacter sp. S6]QUD90243.1 MFS transporter [Caulobacter sp. S6]